MSTFLLEIVTPDRIAYQKQVKMVVVPGSEGYMGILPHHAPLFAILKEGEVKISKDDKDFYLSIGGGFVEITKNKVSILVTKAIHADELKEQEIIKAKKRAEQILREKPEGADIEVAQRLLRSTLVDLKVIRRRKSRRSPPL